MIIFCVTKAICLIVHIWPFRVQWVPVWVIQIRTWLLALSLGNNISCRLLIRKWVWRYVEPSWISWIFITFKLVLYGCEYLCATKGVYVVRQINIFGVLPLIIIFNMTVLHNCDVFWFLFREVFLSINTLYGIHALFRSHGLLQSDLLIMRINLEVRRMSELF